MPADFKVGKQQQNAKAAVCRLPYVQDIDIHRVCLAVLHESEAVLSLAIAVVCPCHICGTELALHHRKHSLSLLMRFGTWKWRAADLASTGMCICAAS